MSDRGRLARHGRSVVFNTRATVLRDLLAVAELNHALLCHLFPAIRIRSEGCFTVVPPGGRAERVEWRVSGRGPFTTFLEIAGTGSPEGGLRPLRVTVRLCHDAKVAEIVGFDRPCRLQARYPYPNSSMHQPDEKLQANRFLGEWARHCLRWGTPEELPSPA